MLLALSEMPQLLLKCVALVTFAFYLTFPIGPLDIDAPVCSDRDSACRPVFPKSPGESAAPPAFQSSLGCAVRGGGCRGTKLPLPIGLEVNKKDR